MAASKKSRAFATRRQNRADTSRGRVLAANSSTQRLNFEQQQRAEHPARLEDAFKRARYYARESSFLTMFLPLKRSIHNYGFRLKPAAQKGKPPAKDASRKLNEWLDEISAVKFQPYEDPQTRETIEIESTATNRELISKFVEDAWDEFILLDNVASLWLDEWKYAITLPPEKCEFSDTLGIPILKYTHGLSAEQLKQLDEAQQEQFKRASITLNAANGQHFKVLKRARVGDGFAWPLIYSAFRLLGEVEAKEVGMNLMAFCMRKVTRWHKLGHEIKNGDRAGKPIHFWNQKRSDAVKKLWVDVVGVDDYTSNFDEGIEFPWPDMKFFDETAWRGSNLRLTRWGGPLAEMLVAKGVMPYLTLILKSQALDERAKMGPYLSVVINEAFAPPVPVQASWSNMIFNESRLAAEMLKFALQSGLLSAKTAKEEIGLDPLAEEEQKVLEADDKEAVKKFRPLWDAAHALAPALGETAATARGQAPTKRKGAAPGAQSGKPPGTQDTA